MATVPPQAKKVAALYAIHPDGRSYVYRRYFAMTAHGSTPTGWWTIAGSDGTNLVRRCTGRNLAALDAEWPQARSLLEEAGFEVTT